MANEKLKAESLIKETSYTEPSLRCFNMHLHNTSIYNLIFSSVILDKVEQIMGANFLLWRTVFIGKPGNCCAVPWHKDTYQGGKFVQNISCWLALSNITEENGCLEFIRGSHKEDIGIKEIYQDSKFKKDFASSPNLLPPPGVDHDRIAKNLMSAGEFVLFDQRVLHGSGPNTTAHERNALIMRYVPTDTTLDLGSPCMLMRGEIKGCKQKVISPPPRNFLLRCIRKAVCRKAYLK